MVTRLRPGAWIRHRVDGRFALVEAIIDDVVVYWKEEVPPLQGCLLDEFNDRWSIFHGYKTYGQREAPPWVSKGNHVYSRFGGVRHVVLGTRLRGAWVMLEATPWLATADERWLTVRTGNNILSDFGPLPTRFERPAPV